MHANHIFDYLFAFFYMTNHIIIDQSIAFVLAVHSLGLGMSSSATKALKEKLDVTTSAQCLF